MNPNKKWLVAVILVVVIAVAVTTRMGCYKGKEGAVETDYVVTNGTVRVTVKSTASVEPQNRLEVKPPTAGRIEEILVNEGDKVKVGQIVGWISSTERASLLDAAMAHGADEQKYWQEVYKPTALRAPIEGEVIVRDFEPGQSITVASAVIVLSDRLIVKAQVDETDIGKVKIGQEAEIALDAYPDEKCMGRIDHISYESKLLNNVTIYEVDVVPGRVSDVFRSGMSATVTIICNAEKSVPLVPGEAISTDKDGAFVMVRGAAGEKPERRKIVIGVPGENGDEIADGLRAGDVVVITRKKYQLPAKDKASNLLMPFGGSSKRKDHK